MFGGGEKLIRKGPFWGATHTPLPTTVETACKLMISGLEKAFFWRKLKGDIRERECCLLYDEDGGVGRTRTTDQLFSWETNRQTNSLCPPLYSIAFSLSLCFLLLLNQAFWDHFHVGGFRLLEIPYEVFARLGSHV